MCLVCSETKSSIPSVDRLVKDLKCQTSHTTPSQSLNAAANQLDIFQIASNPYRLGIGHTAAGGHVQCTIVIKMFLLPHPLWMTTCLLKCLLIIIFLLHCTWHVSITHVCAEKPTFVLSFIYMCDIIWPRLYLRVTIWPVT